MQVWSSTVSHHYSRKLCFAFIRAVAESKHRLVLEDEDEAAESNS